MSAMKFEKPGATLIVRLYFFCLIISKFNLKFQPQILYLPPANEVCEGYVFTVVCLSTGGTCMPKGVCMAKGGMRGEGGMCVAKVACMAKGTCMPKGGMCDKEGCAW